MPPSTSARPRASRAWLVVAIALHAWLLARALDALRMIARQWTEWFFVLGPRLGTERLILEIAAALAFGVAIVGLWRRRGWGWSIAVVADVLGLAFAAYAGIGGMRRDILVPVSYLTALAVLLFTPAREGFTATGAPNIDARLAGAGSRVLAWWDGEPTFDRRATRWIGMGLAAVCAYLLLMLLFSPYVASRPGPVLGAFLGVCIGVLLVKAGGVPAYVAAITWLAWPLVMVWRYIAADPVRHHVGAARPFVAGGIVVWLWLVVALAHEIRWLRRSRGRSTDGGATPPAAETAPSEPPASPAAPDGQPDRLARARLAVLRHAALSMALLVPFVWMQMSFTKGAARLVGSPLEHVLTAFALALALATIEIAFLVVVVRLRKHADPVAGAIASGAGVLWLGVIILLVIAGALPGPYGIPWVFFLLNPVGLIALLAVVLFVRAQRILIREGDILCAGTRGRAALAEHSLARLLPAICLIGGLASAAMLRSRTRSYAEHVHARRLEAYRRAHPPKPLPTPLPGLVRLWTVPLVPAAAGGVVTPALMRDGTVIVAGDSGLVAVARDGSLRWRNDAVRAGAGNVAIDASGTIYVTGHGDSLYAVRPDGALQWVAYVGRRVGALPDSLLPPVATRDAVYARARDGSLVRVSRGGRILWSAPFDAAVTPPSAQRDGSIWVVGESGRGFTAHQTLYHIDAAGRIVSRIGLRRWSGPDAPPVSDAAGNIYLVDGADLLRVTATGVAQRVVSSPAIADGIASTTRDVPEQVVVAVSGLLNAFAPNGTARWTTTMTTGTGQNEHIVSAAAAATGGRLAVSTTSRVVMIRMTDGAPVTEFAFEPWVYTKEGGYTPTPAGPPVIASDGTIYVVDAGGRLLALRDTVGTSGSLRRRAGM